MGSFFDILCCSGGSEDTLPANNAKYQSTNKSSSRYSQREVSPLHSQISNKLDSRKSNMSSQSNSKKIQKTSSTTKNTTPQTKKQQTQQPPQDKTDVTVYEGTDSTVETANDGNDNGDSSIQIDKYSQDQSSFDSEEVGDEDEDEEVINAVNDSQDEFFDLTKLQPGQAHAESGWLLNPAPQSLKNRKCLILDLDETLVHSSFKYLRQADFVIPVDIDNQLHNVYVIKRPGVDEFMKRVGELYEVVVFTASVSRYGDPLLDALDIHKAVHHRLFRDSCYNYQGNYIKNLSQIGRPLGDLIILDNSPASYVFHPQHAIPISSWFSDAHDNELLDIIPFLEDLAKDNVEDIGLVLDINL